MSRVDVETLDRAIEEARRGGLDGDVRSLLRWAYETLGDQLVMSTAFGKSGMVILHVLKDEVPEVPVYFIDTGFHFPETLEFVERLRSEWGARLLVHGPELRGKAFEERYGERPWERDPDFCCHKNKVDPFRELIGETGRYQGWITGVRRDQSSTRAFAEPIERLEGGLVKIQPLAHWKRARVEEYLRENEVPLHPLFARGYPSIGCQPCTRAVGEGTDERAGRWAGKDKTECGLHTFWKKVEAARAGRQPAPEEARPGPTDDEESRPRISC